MMDKWCSVKCRLHGSTSRAALTFTSMKVPNHPPLDRIESRILVVRGQKVMLDADLAELYGVKTKRFNEQVRRNRERFPADFMFRLTDQEVANLRSQFGDGSRFSVERMTVAGHVRP